jgi:PadR family transcriptional regulator AphA
MADMSLRHALLGLLADEPGSGYDLLKRFQTAMANVWSATQSQLYGELGKLEKASLIKVMEEGPRGRREYKITEAGREELRSWLLTPPPLPARNETLLKVYFLGSVAPEQAQDYMRQLREAATRRTAHLTDLEASIDWGVGAAYIYGRLVLEWGKRHSEMQRDWAEWAIAEITAAEANQHLATDT